MGIDICRAVARLEEWKMGPRQEKDSKDSLEQEILELVRLKLYQRMRGLGPRARRSGILAQKPRSGRKKRDAIPHGREK